MKTVKWILVFVIALIALGCPHGDEEFDIEIKLVNNSKSNLYFQGAVRDVYPENFLGNDSDPPQSHLNPNSKRTISLQSDWFKNEIYEFRLFLYTEETLQNNDWETVKDNGLYDARYDLTLEELEAMDFEIVYDGM